MAPSQARGEIECVKIGFKMPTQCYSLKVVVDDSALELHAWASISDLDFNNSAKEEVFT